MHPRESYDGPQYGTTDALSFENGFKPEKVGRKTVNIGPGSRFVKVLVENLDGARKTSDVKIIVTLGG